jgi:hypothetical protein
MWERYEGIPDKRPFMFFSTTPRPIVSKTGVETPGLDEVGETTLYGRRAKSYEKIKPTLRRADNHQPFRIEDWLGMVRHETLNDALREYFNRSMEILSNRRHRTARQAAADYRRSCPDRQSDRTRALI